jgi:transcription antitermination protein NusB
MIRARKVREIALQLLFAWDAAGEADEKTALQVSMDASPDDATTRLRAMEAANKTWEYRKQADDWAERLAPQWPPRRMPSVDRNLIRLALWELTGGQTPPKVVLDEAIELAKLYSTENSPAFINGVLDAALREVTALKPDAPTA